MGRAGYLVGEPSFADAFGVLCLQAADDGRGPALFGNSASRVREVVAPFLVGKLFPEIYLEFPLVGDPFLDVTLLYGDLAPGTRIDSPLAEGTGDVLDLYARMRAEMEDRNDASSVSFGFELDCGKRDVPAAAMHFQPRARLQLVGPFCEAIGEPQRADLYLAQQDRMPSGWPLSFFGLFRGRPGSPLRVCGYLSRAESAACAEDPSRIGRALERAGFAAPDQTMLAQATRVLALAPEEADFQLDVLPDGSLGPMFALDVRFDSMTSEEVRASFEQGDGAAIVSQLREWGIADERAEHIRDMSLTRGVLVRHEDGTTTRYGFSLVPGWLKVRWIGGELQPSKMYLRASAGPVHPKE